MKATTTEIQIIKRLISVPPDPVVLAELFEYSYHNIVQSLKRKFPNGDQDDIYEIAFQSVDRFAKSPHRFDPEKNTLTGYLVMDAIGDMLNLISKNSRKINLNLSVEDWDTHGKYILDEAPNHDLEELALETLKVFLRKLFPNETDFEFALMMETGVRETNQYAKLLRIEDQSSEKQREVVKRNKDRIVKQLERNNWKNVKKKIRDQLL